MPSDSSQLLYVCPICDRPFRSEDECREHITASKSDGHSGWNGHTMGRPLDIRRPDIETYDYDDWESKVRLEVESEYSKQAEVPYAPVAETLDLPEPFVAWYLKYQMDRKPVMEDGAGLHHMALRWDDLTDKQQHTLLAWAYYPELTHKEVAGLKFSGHAYQGTVSQTIRMYGWMLGHPELDTPIQPVEKSEQGEVTMTGGVDDMLESLKSDEEEEEPEADEEPVPDIEEEMEQEAAELVEEMEAEAEDEPDEEEPESGREPRGSQPESGAPEPGTATVSPGVTFLESDLAFEAISALIETGQHEEAREVFRRATGEEELDIRWEAGDE